MDGECGQNAMLIPTAKSGSVAKINVVEQHPKRAQYNA